MLVLNIPGYESVTTFWNAFSEAEKLCRNSVLETYKYAFRTAKKFGVKYLTELAIVLNHKIWQWYEEDEVLARTYNDIWQSTDKYCLDNLKGKDLQYYLKITD